MKTLTMTLLYCALTPTASGQLDYTQFVNPLIGSEGPIDGFAAGGGDTFVGAAVPFGAVKLGIDTLESRIDIATINGGYTPQGNVTGISMMHESGTGGFPKYGIISQMPLTTLDGVNILDNTTYWQNRTYSEEKAEVGYFKTRLDSGVVIELGAASHAGLLQYTFPSEEKHVLVDVSHYLPEVQGGHGGQYFNGGHINIGPNGSYTGYGAWGGGFSESNPMTVFFCGVFDTPPTQSVTFIGTNTDAPRGIRLDDGGMPKPTFGSDSQSSGPYNDRIGALFSWDASSSNRIRARLGISMISVEKACSYRDSEIPTYDMNTAVAAARTEWNNLVLSKIRVATDATANQTNVQLLYSSLYLMHLMPSNRTGENPLWYSDEPYWDDFYAIWDIFRSSTTLYQLIQPDALESMIRALIDIWRYEGYMPDARSGNDNGIVQGGSDADNMLADAYVRGVRGAINWTDGYAAMVKNAEIVPYNTFSQTDPSNGIKEGRGALEQWLQYGYLPNDDATRSISRAVEYSLNDFAVSQVARGEAPDDVRRYLNRSANWQNGWSADAVSVNTTPIFRGFMAPRLSDGTFNLSGFNPATCAGCSWRDITYEATPFEYSFGANHDVETMIDLMGGPEAFEQRLDYIFQPNTSQQNLGVNGFGIDTIMNIGNEPDFPTPYLYHYLNKSHKSITRTRALVYRYFTTSTTGLPGNSDAGALNSWLIWAMLGLYPVVTQPVFLLGSPMFPDVNITINGNQMVRILAPGVSEGALEGEGANVYVTGVKLNGETWDKNWVEHGDLMVEGGTLEFEVGRKPVIWETGSTPPSPGRSAR